MSHTRKVCPHDITVSQCRCARPHKAVEVVRPCPFGDKHLGYAVVHPEYATGGTIQPVQPVQPVQAVQAFKQCVFRTCDWTIAEPDSLFQLAALDAEIRVHLRTHRVEIELMTRYIQ